jgi:hypothetical protein
MGGLATAWFAVCLMPVDCIANRPRPSNSRTRVPADPQAPVEQALLVWPHAVAVAPVEMKDGAGSWG